MIIGLVGMTATGKSEIAKELVKLGIPKIVTTTTRPNRSGEVDGVDYNFISDSKFEKMKKNHEFVETTSYNTVYGIWKYGTPISALRDDGVIILNPDGLKAFRDMNINCKVFYIQASEGVVRNRLRFRGDSQEEADRRIKTDKKDFKNIDKLTNFTIRNEGEMTPKLAAHIIFEIYQILKKEDKK